MGTVILDTSKTVATEMEIQFFKYMNYVPIVVATDLEVKSSQVTFIYIALLTEQLSCSSNGRAWR